jgi:hypothetical protein
MPLGVKITCPKCAAEGFFSLRDHNFSGAYKCWKCREYFNLVIENDTIKSITPFTAEQTQQQLDWEEAKKHGRG